MRFALTALAVFALAACGQNEEAAPGAEAPPAEGSVLLGSTQNLPDWLLVARQAGTCSEGETCRSGDVHFNQRSIVRNPDGTADIWIQVHYAQQQLWTTATETTDTVIRYELERVHYRFKCAEEQFTILERQIMGANELVVARDEPLELYRSLPSQSSVTRVIMPIACRGV